MYRLTLLLPILLITGCSNFNGYTESEAASLMQANILLNEYATDAIEFNKRHPQSNGELLSVFFSEQGPEYGAMFRMPADGFKGTVTSYVLPLSGNELAQYRETFCAQAFSVEVEALRLNKFVYKDADPHQQFLKTCSTKERGSVLLRTLSEVHLARVSLQFYNHEGAIEFFERYLSYGAFDKAPEAMKAVLAAIEAHGNADANYMIYSVTSEEEPLIFKSDM